MDRRRRLSLTLLFLIAAAALCVGYGATEDARSPYPMTDEIAADYEAHVGEDILVFGTVEAIDGGRVTITTDTDAGPLSLTVSGVDRAVQPGGVLQVYGRLEMGHTIDATRIVVVNDSPGAELGKFAVSGLGALLFLGLFFRYWRVDLRGLAVEVRDSG